MIHLDYIECDGRRVPVDMYIEMYGTGRLPRKYEKALERFFKTKDKRRMLWKALNSDKVPVLCPDGRIEIVERTVAIC